jgi:hypothetical protein
VGEDCGCIIPLLHWHPGGCGRIRLRLSFLFFCSLAFFVNDVYVYAWLDEHEYGHETCV